MNSNDLKSTNEPTGKDNVFPILDSRLIVTTILGQKYNAKVVKCGDYVQIYMYEKCKKKSSKKDTTELELRKLKLSKLFENEEDIKTEPKLVDDIEQRNIIRSKLECQRIAKSNIDEWKTFITLTFKENIKDVSKANKRFRYFIDKVQRIKKDFKYIAIPEFQKRGATHYHLLTNIDINDTNLIYEQEDNKKYKHIKYWLDGFTKVDTLNGDIKKIIGYISKYMTKDIDNRLFNRHRYFYSRNLNMPSVSYINFDSPKDLEFFKKNIQDKELIYQNEYISPFDNNTVSFLEYLRH